MADGITTVVSRSPMPEKVADVTDRAADNKQQATAVVVQQHAEAKMKVVQNMDKLDSLQAVKKKEEKEEDSRKKREGKEDKRKGNTSGFHLDIKA